jgi:pyruvate dehydrogenase E2 component (dihydrolipoamide acetyltransferase)
MERVFAMPDLGEGLEEGTIVTWRVRAGDAVTMNQPLVEVETAKVTVEIPSPIAGVVLALHGEEGDDVPVGAALVTFEVVGGEPARATPPIRRLAKELGVDIDTVDGSGPQGRVVEADVRHAAGGTTTRIEVTGVRRATAERLTRQAAIPQVTTFRTLDATALEAVRAEADVSPLPIVVAAICHVAAEHPIVNAVWAGDAIDLRPDIHVGIAVDTAHGLMIPVVEGAADRGIAALADEIRRLADAARAGASPIVATPATIAVSNTGSYGSEAGTPILSPGTSVTLAIGTIGPRALVVDGAVQARPAATLSLTFDHRVLDGAAAGRFLTDLVAVLQSPDRLRDLPR